MKNLMLLFIVTAVGMLERGEIDVALTDLSLTFPRSQVISDYTVWNL